MNIHEIYIEVKDQAQADRLKDICLKYGLPIWDDTIAFEFDKDSYNYFYRYNEFDGFSIGWFKQNLIKTHILITEQQFIKLLEDGK